MPKIVLLEDCLAPLLLHGGGGRWRSSGGQLQFNFGAEVANDKQKKKEKNMNETRAETNGKIEKNFTLLSSWEENICAF